jgi:hypothetical protein
MRLLIVGVLSKTMDARPAARWLLHVRPTADAYRLARFSLLCCQFERVKVHATISPLASFNSLSDLVLVIVLLPSSLQKAQVYGFSMPTLVKPV